MKFDYIYGKQADQYSFVRIPKRLVTEKHFANVSLQAKVLYGLLIDRMGMSAQNAWLDEEKRMYIIYPIDEISKDMGVSRRKAIECLSELEKKGLIQKQARGNGLPNLLYVKDFVIT